MTMDDSERAYRLNSHPALTHWWSVMMRLIRLLGTKKKNIPASVSVRLKISYLRFTNSSKKVAYIWVTTKGEIYGFDRKLKQYVELPRLSSDPLAAQSLAMEITENVLNLSGTCKASWRKKVEGKIRVLDAHSMALTLSRMREGYLLKSR